MTASSESLAEEIAALQNATAGVRGVGTPESDLIAVVAKTADMPTPPEAAKASCPDFVKKYKPFEYKTLSYPQNPSLTAQKVRRPFVSVPFYGTCTTAKNAASSFHSRLKTVTDVQDKVDNYGQLVAGVGANSKQLYADLVAVEKVLCHSIPTLEKLSKIKKFKKFADPFVRGVKALMDKTGKVNTKNAEVADTLAQAKREVQLAEKEFYQSRVCSGSAGAELASALNTVANALSAIEQSLPSFNGLNLQSSVNALNSIKAQMENMKNALSPVYDAVTLLDEKLVTKMKELLSDRVCLYWDLKCSGTLWQPGSWRCHWVCGWEPTVDELLDAAGFMQTLMDKLPLNPIAALVDAINGAIISAVGKPLEEKLAELADKLKLDEKLGIDEDFTDSLGGIDKAMDLLNRGVNLDTSNLPSPSANSGYVKIGHGKDCCRYNNAQVGSVKNWIGNNPRVCEAGCNAIKGCRYFSHSTTWQNCVYCSRCDLSSRSNGFRYTSWQKM